MPRGVKYESEEARLAARRASKAKYRASEAGKAKEREYAAAWRAANPDKVKANNARTREDYPRERYVETQQRCSARWYRENADRRAEEIKAWRQANPERLAEYQRRRRARRMGANPDLTLEEWLDILDEFDHCCAYCQARGVKLEQEHMTPLSRGGRHTKSNIVPACRSCNARKGTKNLLEFARMG